jgi:hypothetical protein
MLSEIGCYTAVVVAINLFLKAFVLLLNKQKIKIEPDSYRPAVM